MAFFNKFTETSTAAPEEGEIQSILDNLNNVLNTKKGYGSFLEGYGIRDMNKYTSREHMAAAIMDEVVFNIEQYEPRLKLVGMSVENTDDPFRIAFKIECTVRETAQSLFMEFDSVYNDFSLKD